MRKKKPQPPCAIKDCAALSRKDSEFCAVHAAMPRTTREYEALIAWRRDSSDVTGDDDE